MGVGSADNEVETLRSAREEGHLSIGTKVFLAPLYTHNGSICGSVHMYKFVLKQYKRPSSRRLWKDDHAIMAWIMGSPHPITVSYTKTPAMFSCANQCPGLRLQEPNPTWTVPYVTVCSTSTVLPAFGGAYLFSLQVFLLFTKLCSASFYVRAILLLLRYI